MNSMIACSESLSNSPAMQDYIERVVKTLAPSGAPLSWEMTLRYVAAIQELSSNSCLTCRYDPLCGLPNHGLPVDISKPCLSYEMMDYGECFTRLFQRYFPEYDWEKIFAGIDWQAQEHAALSATANFMGKHI